MFRNFSRFARRALPGLAFLSVAVMLVAPSYADDHDRWRGDHDRDHWRWREHGWHDYNRRPDVYYSAPPVVYSPYGYYAPQPGVSLNFSFPIR
jgi:hypothetical protein